VAAEAAGVVADHQSARSDIFALVLKHKEYFLGQVGGLPDVRGFLKVAADDLRLFLEERWARLLEGSPSPLVVNILINPNLLFCSRDAMLGQYSKYFRPVYLDSQAIRLDKGENGIEADSAAQAIVRLHKTFDQHYDEDLDARPFLSLNDIEALLVEKGIKTPFPPANKVISISRTAEGGRGAPFRILCDHDDYKDAIDEALRKIGASRATDKFKHYLEQVTEHQGSYHHVTFGSDTNWVGRVYLAFRNNDAYPDRLDWITGVKDFAFVVLAPLALAGTFLRNPGIIEMLAGVRKLLSQSDDFRRSHLSIIEQFAGAAAQANRGLLPSTNELGVLLSEFKTNRSDRLVRLWTHVAQRTPDCNCPPKERVIHAIEHCSAASTAFLGDVRLLLTRTFEELDETVIQFLVHALAFGVTGQEDRPKTLKAYFADKNIPDEWLISCRNRSLLKDVPPASRPALRALLMMVGNQAMVRNDAIRVGLTLGAVRSPYDVARQNDGKLLARVEFSVTGKLSQTGERPLKLPDLSTLHPNKAGLLLHFGKLFLDEFQMCITTKLGNEELWCSHQWDGERPTKNGTITFGFRFS
jgi:hypothetical protein